VVGGEGQDSGVRIKSICSPPTAFCVLPTDTVDGRSQVVGGGRTGVRSQDEEYLPSADRLLHLRGIRVGGTLGPYRSLRQDVTADRERRNQ